MGLIDLDRQTKKKILVIGDAMRDEYVHGVAEPSQDGCFKFTQQSCHVVPGGAANAARQLTHWHAESHLASVISFPADSIHCVRTDGYNDDLCLKEGLPAIKRRFISEGRIVWRHDCYHKTIIIQPPVERHHKIVLQSLKAGDFDAVLISDYTKGFLTENFIRDIIDFCRYEKIPVVADAKQRPGVYQGAIIKGNCAYDTENRLALAAHQDVVMTDGSVSPWVWYKAESRNRNTSVGQRRPVACVNHVGAGDCFAAHLVLALAHGLSLIEAATFAHSAGRVYVQHKHSRPPWPHEIQRDLDPVGGKCLCLEDLTALRRSAAGRIVFTNGVFRVPHAGHVAMLQWAKRQGDVLVVGINDDASVGKIRPDQFCLPLAERVGVLVALECVDWIVPFSDRDPCAVMKQLQPDVLVKGQEYGSLDMPGANLVREVKFAPMLNDLHATKLLKS